MGHQGALHRSTRATDEVLATAEKMLSPSPQQHHQLLEEHRKPVADFMRPLALKVVQEPRSRDSS